MIKVIKKEPAREVLKEVICRSCGVTLSYVPNDVESRQHSYYDGSTDTILYIMCPECKKEIQVD